MFTAAKHSAPATTKPIVPDHELVRLIGRGSYGEVWLARNAIGTLRAAKIVHRATFERERPYEREFAGLQKFEPISRTHQGLVDILQLGRNDTARYFYYVMELADDAAVSNQLSGLSNQSQEPRAKSLITDHCLLITSYIPKTLRYDLEHRGRLPLAECIDLGLALTSALAHLHQHGLVHRDVKPSNIIFVGGVPKLADIGLVADMGEARSFVGTDGFIPPEGPGSPSADLYSLGKVLYEISTGLDRQDFPNLPPDLKDSPDRAGLSELNEIIIKACASEPKQRYARAEEMLADLEFLHRGKSVMRRRTRQQRWAVCKKACIAIALLTLVAAALVLSVQGRRVGDLHSSIAEVDNLVAQGNRVIGSSTSESLETALTRFKEAAALDPNFVPAYVGVFRVRLEQCLPLGNDAPDAERNVRRAAKKLMEKSSLAEARIARAYINELDGHDREALADAESATQMRSSCKEGGALVHIFYARQLMRYGRIEEALPEYRLAEEVFPSDPVILSCVGLPYLAKRDLPTALKYFKQAIDIEDRCIGAHRWAGRVYEELADFPKAIEQLKRCDELSGRDKGTQFYEDLLRDFEKDGPKGYWKKRLQAARDESPRDLYRIPAILAHLGRTNEAYQSLEEACMGGEYDLGDSLLDLCWNREDEGFKRIAEKFWPDKMIPKGKRR